MQCLFTTVNYHPTSHLALNSGAPEISGTAAPSFPSVILLPSSAMNLLLFRILFHFLLFSLILLDVDIRLQYLIGNLKLELCISDEPHSRKNPSSLPS